MILWLVASALAQEPEVGPVSEGGTPTPSTGVVAPPDDGVGSSFSFNEDFEIRYWKVTERLPGFEDRQVLNYVEQVNRIVGTVSSGKWGFNVQVDEVALFANRYYLDDVLYVERELVAPDTTNVMPGESYANVEKIRLKYETPDLNLALGDSYAAFGRGAALNLNRNVDIDIDSSIQGAKAIGHVGRFDLVGVVGQLNRQQVFQDNPNAAATEPIQDDRRHAVAGVRAEGYGFGPANIGAHAVYYKFTPERGLVEGFEQIAEPTPTTAVAGATLELVGIGGIDWFAEGNFFSFSDDMPQPLPSADVDDPGYTAYVSASGYPGAFVVLVEGKRYYQGDRVNSFLGAAERYEVAIAPTLEYERAITEDSAAALNSNDIWGGRVQVDWVAIPGKLTPYAALAVFRDRDLSAIQFSEVPETGYHPMVGVQYLGGHTTVIANAGYRTEDRDGRDPENADRQLHGDSTIQFPVGPLIGDVAIGSEWFRWGINERQQTDYVEAETSWSLTWKSRGTLTWYNDFSNNPIIDSEGNLSERVYGAVEVQVKPTPAFTLKAFYGAYKAGIRCSGGQCRQLPGFEGARMSAVATF